MREIEVKAKLRNRAAFLTAAKELHIVFGAAVVQDDKTYEGDLPYSDPHWNIFRLRVQRGKTILTMKHKASDRSRDNYEYETCIETPNEIVKMLQRLGYEPGVRLVKRRQIAHHNGIEISLDDIDELGAFVEVEKMAPDAADVDAIQAELWELLLNLGVLPEDRTHKGYDTLMHEHQKYMTAVTPGA